MRKILEEFRDKTTFSEWFVDVVDLLEMAKMILENNYFEFNEEIYWQRQGTAIGTKFAPAFANIFMYVLETKMLQECDWKPWIWWRFLDDIFFIWMHGEQRLREFLNFINSYYNTIKYTWDWSMSQVSFLDVTISKDVGGSVFTDVYSKPTDTHQYLESSSCHPRHVKQAIPYGQALRLKRICNSESKFDQRVGELKKHLRDGGFKERQIVSQFERAKSNDRRALLFHRKEKYLKSKLPLVLNFHPALSGVGEVVNSLWPVLQASDGMREILGDMKPLISFRRPRNLADNLIRSKVKKVNVEGKGMKKCDKARCQICNFVVETQKFEHNGHTYWINYSFDCDSIGVIYLLKCARCFKVYVGSTITTFRKMFNNHKSSLRKYGQGISHMADEHLYAHFFGEEHEGLVDLRVIIIDKTNMNDPTQREAFWAYILDTFAPKGLNVRDLG